MAGTPPQKNYFYLKFKIFWIRPLTEKLTYPLSFDLNAAYTISILKQRTSKLHWIDKKLSFSLIISLIYQTIILPFQQVNVINKYFFSRKLFGDWLKSVFMCFYFYMNATVTAWQKRQFKYTSPYTVTDTHPSSLPILPDFLSFNFTA